MIEFLFYATLLAIGVAVNRVYVRNRVGRIARIDKEFRGLRAVNHLDERFSYDGSTAIVVFEDVDDRVRPDQRVLEDLPVVQRVFRNEFNEYFLFISGQPPFVTHLSRERAMHAIKGDSQAYQREFGKHESNT